MPGREAQPLQDAGTIEYHRLSRFGKSTAGGVMADKESTPMESEVTPSYKERYKRYSRLGQHIVYDSRLIDFALRTSATGKYPLAVLRSRGRGL